MMNSRDIERLIKSAIPDAEVRVRGEDGEHFSAVVVSPTFRGMPLVKQHQMVIKVLKDAFSGPLHALAVKTYTPENWTKDGAE